MASRPRLDSLSSVEEDDYDTLADIDSDKNVIRTKVCRAGAVLQAVLWGRGWGGVGTVAVALGQC